MVILLLYHCGKAGATFEELESWVRPSMRGELRRTIDRLVNSKAFVHDEHGRFTITQTGLAEVEGKKLYRLPSGIEPLESGRLAPPRRELFHRTAIGR